jgi:hypothetical protein
MAIKGAQAKDNLTKLIIEALGDNFVLVQDKKIYANMDDGGEMVQIAISMTMPKTPVAGPVGVSTASPPAQTELSESDKAKIQELKAKLGIN